jgi:hypothetical protein
LTENLKWPAGCFTMKIVFAVSLKNLSIIDTIFNGTYISMATHCPNDLFVKHDEQYIMPGWCPDILNISHFLNSPRSEFSDPKKLENVAHVLTDL